MLNSVVNINKFSICLCFVADDKFIKGSTVMLYSLLKNDPSLRNITMICFYDNEISPLSKENMAFLSSISTNIIFKEISSPDYRNFPVKYVSHNLSLLKFECFKLIEYDFIFYIDTDVLVLKPISVLIGALIDSSCDFLCVENTSRSWSFNEYQFSAFSANAGFFLFRGNYSTTSIKLIYKEFIQEVSYIKNSSIKREMICQPIFNSVLSKFKLSYISAPIGYNFRNLSEFDRFETLVSVIHYVTRTLDKKKPWQLSLKNNSFLSLDEMIWTKYYKEAIESTLLNI